MSDAAATEVVPAADLAPAALALARRFATGATMWCVAPAWPQHARHVAVEFVHPVVVGKRALPAVAVEGPDAAAALEASIRHGDVLVVIGPEDAVVADLLRRVRPRQVETVWIGAGARSSDVVVDHLLWTDGDDPLVAHSGRLVLQYHLLWEMTHVCFEHPGLLGQPVATVPRSTRAEEVCITCSDEGRVGEVLDTADRGLAMVRTADGDEEVDVTLVAPVQVGDLVLVHAGAALTAIEPATPSVAPREPSDFLYPFIESDERDRAPLLADLARSAEDKAMDSRRLAAATIAEAEATLDTVAAAVVERAALGGVVLTFGNGGSATDARGLASLFTAPPRGRPLAARSLVDDPAVLTALANDVGFDLVFSRQVIAHGRPPDIALGFSTSGDSVNLLHAFAEARSRGMLTVAIVGGGGGRCASSPDVDHCVIVRSDSVHRIQEAQAEIAVDLWARGQRQLEATA
jgi:phosphoheptose isomerase/hydrogenase maturation factor